MVLLSLFPVLRNNTNYLVKLETAVVTNVKRMTDSTHYLSSQSFGKNCILFVNIFNVIIIIEAFEANVVVSSICF